MSNSSIPYELRIGVTGHRNLTDADATERAVEALLLHIKSVFAAAAEHPMGPAGSPFTLSKRCDRLLLSAAQVVWPALPVTAAQVREEQRTPLQWVIVSPLAKGADRIVARAVLKQPQETGQPRLQVVTPFAIDDYRRDFEDPSDRKEFEELLQFDSAPTVLPHDYGVTQTNDSPEQRAEKQEIRNAGYLAVGKRVVDACEILIVIWNGQPAAGKGGTADIVEYAVQHGRTTLWIDSSHPDRPARQIVGLAEELQSPQTCDANGLVLRPLPQRAKELSPGFHQLAAYNRDPAFDRSSYEEVLSRNQAELLKWCKIAALPFDSIAPVVNLLLPHYARADQLAIRYQKLYVQAAAWLQRLSSIAVTVVVVQVLFFPEYLWLILFEMLAMLLAVLLLRISRREAWHEKWLRDRHLAERLRIAMFATIAQSGRRTPPRPDEALPFYQCADDWIVDTCDRLAVEARRQPTSPGELEQLKKFLIAAWIGDQAQWHAKNSRRKGHAAHQAHRLGVAFFTVTMLMALLHLLGVGHASGAEHHNEHSSGFWSQLITALAITLPAWGATIHALNTLLERERISSRSGQMAKVLKQLANRAEQARTPEEFAAVIRQAEELMLMENHEWWVSLSFRPPILPA